MRFVKSLSRTYSDEEIQKAERDLSKIECEDDHLFFTRYFFRARQNIKFRVNWHHRLIGDIVDDVIAGRKRNVLITVAPGSSKTELVVINFIARGLAINPWSRFLHLSGSDSLASLNSATAREIVQSDEYQAFWPMKIADDSNAKKRWNVMVGDKIAGGVYATSIGGQVTGFRAGHMQDGFQGAILCDDLAKPELAFSKNGLDQINRKLLTTVKSRKANPDTPIVVIMQRIAEMDPAGFIKAGNVEGDWHFVTLPAVIDDAYVATLEPKYRDLIEPSEDVGGRFSYWQYKEPIQSLLAMERGEGADQSGGRISRHVFASQYQQSPVSLGGNIIKGEWFTKYSVLPKIKFRRMFADTALRTKEVNDYSVIEEWGLGTDGKLYLLDLIRFKAESPELQKKAIAFWAKSKNRDVEAFGQLRDLNIEAKASGIGLAQTLKLPPHSIPVKEIERNKDKLTRVMDALPYIEVGSVCIPEAAPFTNDFVAECESFAADGSAPHDDQIDACCDAIMHMIAAGNKIKTWEALGRTGVSVK